MVSASVLLDSGQLRDVPQEVPSCPQQPLQRLITLSLRHSQGQDAFIFYLECTTFRRKIMFLYGIILLLR